MVIYTINDKYRWEIEYNDELQIFVRLCKLKTGWFGIKYWSGCVRGRLIELQRGFNGSEVGCRQGFYYIHTFDSATFDLKLTLTRWYTEYSANQALLFIKKQYLTEVINSLKQHG